MEEGKSFEYEQNINRFSVIDNIKQSIEACVRLYQLVIIERHKGVTNTIVDGEFKSMIIGLLIRLRLKISKSKATTPICNKLLNYIVKVDSELTKLSEMPIGTFLEAFYELQSVAEDLKYTSEETETFDKEHAFMESVIL